MKSSSPIIQDRTVVWLKPLETGDYFQWEDTPLGKELDSFGPAGAQRSLVRHANERGPVWQGFRLRRFLDWKCGCGGILSSYAGQGFIRGSLYPASSRWRQKSSWTNFIAFQRGCTFRICPRGMSVWVMGLRTVRVPEKRLYILSIWERDHPVKEIEA